MSIRRGIGRRKKVRGLNFENAVPNTVQETGVQNVHCIKTGHWEGFP